MKIYKVEEIRTVTEYEMDDYNAVKNNMSDKEAIALLNSINRDYIPTYYCNGEQDDFENFKLHVAVQKGINAIDKQNNDDLSDDGWFSGSSEIKPVDKKFYIVILIGGAIKLVQYRENLHGIKKAIQDLNMPTYCSWSMVDRWIPIDFPDDVKKRILSGMKEWFGEAE